MLISVHVVLGAQLPEAKVTKYTVKRGLGCLVLQDRIQDDLEGLGVSVGSIAIVRYGIGTIPGITPGSPSNVNILLYAPKAKHGRLLFFRIETDGNVTAISNLYHLTRTGKGWSASEGNGGVATYKAMSDYATELMKQPAITLNIAPQSKGCMSDK